MQKLLIDVEVPAIQRTFEVNVPDNLSVGKTISLLSKLVSEQSNGLFVPSENDVLYKKSDNRIMNNDCTLLDYHVLNGDKLVLL